MKKLIAIALCAGMIFSMAGCKSSTSADTSSGDTQAETPEATKETSSGDKTTVSLLSWYTEEQLADIKAGFEEKNPDLELEIQYVPPTEQYMQKVMLLMNGNEPTDLFFMAPELRESVEETNFAEDLSDLPIMDKLSDSAKLTLGNGKQVYGISLDSWVGCMFYNKDIFEEAGITEEPATWDELVEDMSKISDLGIDPLVAQSEDAGRLLLALFGSDVVSLDLSAESGLSDGSKTFSELYGDSMNSWYDDVIEPKYLSQTCLSLTNDQAEEMFASKKAAMLLGGTWNIPDFNAKNPDLNYSAFAVPGKTGNAMLQGCANVGIGVATNGEHKDEAYRFMDYITSDEGLATWVASFGNFMNVSGVDYTVDSHVEQFKDKVADGQLYWQTVEWSDSDSVLNEFTTNCQNIIAGVSTPEEALEAIDAKIADLIAQ